MTGHGLPLDWTTGTGPWLTLTRCTDPYRITRHATSAAAYQALDHWDLYGCGPHCRLRHTVTHQPDRATT